MFEMIRQLLYWVPKMRPEEVVLNRITLAWQDQLQALKQFSQWMAEMIVWCTNQRDDESIEWYIEKETRELIEYILEKRDYQTKFFKIYREMLNMPPK